jgi:hypothetical protein
MKEPDVHNALFMSDELKKEIDIIMHPERDMTPPQISFIFAFEDEHDADGLLHEIHRMKDYTMVTKHDTIFYRVDFSTEEVTAMYKIYQMIDILPHKEILINNFKLPYSGSLWLSLLWFYL